uniref:SGNH domain-containing protein n=1 Tax=Magallana gigas TaxID=29159 RepID=A0A8W8NZY2_MAGGI
MVCRFFYRAFVAARDRPGGESLVLQRRKWRYSEDVNAMNKSLKWLNSSIAAELVGNESGYIKYPDIKPNDELLFGRDGVHLSERGTEIF